MDNISALEAIWVLINTVTLVLTVTALLDARADRTAVKLINGRARELAAWGIVRRERLRVMKQLLLLSIAIPGLFLADGAIRPEPLRVWPVIALMSLALLLLYQSFSDARDRKRLTVLVTAEAVDVKEAAFDRLERAVAENTLISQGARDDAREAVQVANHINEKLVSQGDALLSQGEERAERLAHTEEIVEATATTVDETAAKVDDLHEGKAPQR